MTAVLLFVSLLLQPVWAEASTPESLIEPTANQPKDKSETAVNEIELNNNNQPTDQPLEQPDEDPSTDEEQTTADSDLPVDDSVIANDSVPELLETAKSEPIVLAQDLDQNSAIGIEDSGEESTADTDDLETQKDTTPETGFATSTASATTTTSNGRASPPTISTSTPVANATTTASSSSETEDSLASSVLSTTTTSASAETVIKKESIQEDVGHIKNADPPSESEVDFATTSSSTNITNGSTTPSTTNTHSSTTTEPTDTELVLVRESTADVTFDQDACTLVEDGSYYCQKTTEQTVVAADGIFAALDQDGDLEIFVRKTGEQVQLTSNFVDDAAPFFDPVSNTIVWHRLLDDRYQIISYDIDSGIETQITNTKVNNMQPTRAGDYLAWQRWVGNSWEIILYQDGEETQLTDSVEHDIAPQIRGSLVIWNVSSNDGRDMIRTYDIESGIYNDINDSEGAAVSNPRMVVVYDVLYKNGDTATRGFDLVTGEIISLDKVPASLPEKLPDPDSTGETRALIIPPNKPEQDENDETGKEPTSSSPPDESDELTINLSDSGATTTESVVDIELVGFTLDLSTTTTAVTPPDNTIDDLVIPAANASSSYTSTTNF